VPRPKRPDASAGADYGTQAFRAVPAPEQIDEFYEAPLPDRPWILSALRSRNVDSNDASLSLSSRVAAASDLSPF